MKFYPTKSLDNETNKAFTQRQASHENWDTNSLRRPVLELVEPSSTSVLARSNDYKSLVRKLKKWTKKHAIIHEKVEKS